MEDELAVGDVHRLPDGSLPIGADLVARGWKSSKPVMRMSSERCQVCQKPAGNCTHGEHVRGENMAQQHVRASQQQRRRPPQVTRVNPDKAQAEEQESAEQTIDIAPAQALSEHERSVGLFLDDSTMPRAASQIGDNEAVPIGTAEHVDDTVVVLEADATAPLSRTARERLKVPTGWSGQLPEDESYTSPFDDPNCPRNGYLILPGGNASGVRIILHPTNDNVCKIEEMVYDVLWRRGTRAPIYKLRYNKGRTMTRAMVR